MLHSRYTSAICFTHCGVYVPVSASNSSPTHSPFGVHVFALYVCVCISALQIGSSVPFFSEKAMAPHSSPLAWKIPWKEEPGGLQSMGSLRDGHN